MREIGREEIPDSRAASYSYIQVKQAMYRYRHRNNKCLEVCEDVMKQPINFVEKQAPLTVRFFCSLANFGDRVILASGGYAMIDHYNSVEAYDIEKNSWSMAPSMNEARCMHSSCQLKEEFVYVFFGVMMVPRKIQVKSIERLNMKSVDAATWELIHVPEAFSAQIGAILVQEGRLVAPISKDEVVFLGGFDTDTGFQGDGFTFKARGDPSFKQILGQEFWFYTMSHQCDSQFGKVSALVLDTKLDYYCFV